MLKPNKLHAKKGLGENEYVKAFIVNQPNGSHQEDGPTQTEGVLYSPPNPTHQQAVYWAPNHPTPKALVVSQINGRKETGTIGCYTQHTFHQRQYTFPLIFTEERLVCYDKDRKVHDAYVL
ncbi:unnamed protein product [Bursaphelenchus okinawaensis]|uniref:Uncharacterized protein n=1 Tax=Bursaphelenchus okinawaensis TaxID=465554 RepID=A0A811KWG2_9BILA|nr:unnamed protein product [Bursaphelenchus okinawaensis]CAG9113019.1 unnamed protein product [Bursaphelenchus okinawaensis]